jgi:hypothetical protein
MLAKENNHRSSLVRRAFRNEETRMLQPKGKQRNAEIVGSSSEILIAMHMKVPVGCRAVNFRGMPTFHIFSYKEYLLSF